MFRNKKINKYKEDFRLRIEGKEYLDYIIAVKVVSNINEAIEHIQRYGTKHSEAIITENFTNANYFF